MKRKWWVAALLTVFAGGSGYLYSGHPKRLFVYIPIFILAIALSSVIGFRFGGNPQAIIITMLALDIFLLALTIDSAIAANKQVNFHPRWYNKWWVYLTFGIFSSAAVEVATSNSFSAFRSYNIPAISMAPALMVGDYLFADTYAYQHKRPERGDIVIFKHPKSPDNDWIKRVIGLPGDTVQFINGQIKLNGSFLEQREQENLLTHKDFKRATLFTETLPSGRSYQTLSLFNQKTSGPDNTKVFHVPVGHYFLSGDNRDNSSDSRWSTGIGFVPRKNIYAKAKIIYWSPVLDRVGMLLNPA